MIIIDLSMALSSKDRATSPRVVYTPGWFSHRSSSAPPYLRSADYYM